MTEASVVTALLGPTNTGKTHRAIERMLEHESGVIGLPLRLLAREVYDRVTARVGEQRVALVTGEEKRVPRRPDYWICTVEAMPEDLEVDFVAVDEVQLAANAQRGHVFTDRLLRARGRRETFFLGADTMRRVIAELVPAARVEERPRLSTLSPAGACKLARLPPRSAVVAFSMAQVVEVAERLRALRGGAAVVLGALSPRTRNAQVALFQAGEVDFLVATDAIGMGLNLAVKHVAFAGLRKFDGRVERALDVAEIAQIAGRAGRHLEDGTFGAVLPLALPPDDEADVAAHRFEPVKQIYYRSHDLDFTSVDALVALALGTAATTPASAPRPRRRISPRSRGSPATTTCAPAPRAPKPSRSSGTWRACPTSASCCSSRTSRCSPSSSCSSPARAPSSTPRTSTSACARSTTRRATSTRSSIASRPSARGPTSRATAVVGCATPPRGRSARAPSRTASATPSTSGSCSASSIGAAASVSASKKGARPSTPPREASVDLARVAAHHPFAKLAAWTGARAAASPAHVTDDDRVDRAASTRRRTLRSTSTRAATSRSSTEMQGRGAWASSRAARRSSCRR